MKIKCVIIKMYVFVLCAVSLTDTHTHTEENVPQAGLPYIYHKKGGHLLTIKSGHILFPSK
jgi:hypothetical protein